MRQITNKDFLKSLQVGALSKIVEYVRQDTELDLQIRANYINIYYRGGNILRIKSPNSFEFDKFYFYLDCDKTPKTHLKKSNDPILDDLTERRKKLLLLIQNGEIEKYFKQAKECMDKWWNSLQNKRNIHHNEKDLQHLISRNNNSEKTDYTVLDLEYQVSTQSPYKYNGKENKTSPRFDIVAINNRTRKLCIMELKKDGVALKGDSGVESHIDSFKHTIGRDVTGDFVNEMQQLYNQKRELGLINLEIELLSDPPEFIFVFQGSEKDRAKIEDLAVDQDKKYRVITLVDNIIRDNEPNNS